MKILTLFNDYRQKNSGEYHVVTATQELLCRRGADATLVMRTSVGLDRGLRRKIKAFARGIYSRTAYGDTLLLLARHEPDVVHVHNLYPLLSPSVLVACREAGVRTVMTVHNYRHTCPTSHHYRRGSVCEKCVGGREWQCIARNCRDSLPESVAYGLRAAVARKLRLFHDNIDVLIVGTRFAAQRLTMAGFDEERIFVIPSLGVPVAAQPPSTSSYVAYAGRMTEEKGLATLIEAARRLPDIDFRFAGDGPMYDELVSTSPPNARFLGFLDAARMEKFYSRAACLIVPSEWFEMRPLVICEAMAHAVPVVASRIGGLGELVHDGVTGMLFKPGDADELAGKIRLLTSDGDLRDKLGSAGRAAVVRDHDEGRCFDQLMAAYRKALDIANG